MRQSFIRITVLATAITVLAALPATAGAATTGGSSPGGATITIEVGRATLSQKVVVNVPVTVTCSLNPDALPEFPQNGTGGGIQIVQANGKSQTSGTSGVPAFTCDGLPQTFTLQVLADPVSGGLHFKKGAAAIQASAFAFGFDANFNFVMATVSTEWIGISTK